MSELGNAAHVTLPLWPDGAPDSNGIVEAERVENEGWYYSISVPELIVSLPSPELATGAAIVVIPGGGYEFASMENEGYKVAQWLNSFGVAAFILKYRMPNGHCDIPLRDAQQAIKTVRARAQEWGVDVARVGVLGFSAGGHLASTAATHFDSNLTRPDFSVLIYPVITMDEGYSHGGSRGNLLGPNPSPELVARFSNELRVTKDTPPTFIVFATNDTCVPVENGIRFYRALCANSVSAAFHAYPDGGHGFGLYGPGTAAEWPEHCRKWLAEMGVLTTNS